MYRPRAFRFFLKRCVHAQKQGVVYTLHLFQFFNQSPASKYPSALAPSSTKNLSRRTVTKTRTDGHTSPLQKMMHLLIRLERFEDFYGRMISFTLASLDKIFRGIYNLLLPSRAASDDVNTLIPWTLPVFFKICPFYNKFYWKGSEESWHALFQTHTVYALLTSPNIQ